MLLRRRLFFWFMLAMLITAVAVIGVSTLVARLSGSPPWRDGPAGAERFLSAQFSRVWSDAASRDALAGDLSRAFGLRVDLLDPQRRPLPGYGEAGGHVWMVEPVGPSTAPRGFVRVSMERHGGKPWRIVLALGIAGLVLWAFAGAISRRLAWPFHQLAQVARDIGSGRLKTRASLHRQFGEARVLAHAINEMADRIERQLGEQRELLAAVSHELRTPLARVRLLVELARSGQANGKFLDELDQEAVEMDSLVGELLANARVEFEALSVTPLHPVELAQRALERAGLPASLLRVASPNLPKVSADATLVLRALANLLDNARRHAGGAVQLRVVAEDGHVRFEVEDAGPGFPPGEESRAFQPFRKGRTAAQEGSLGMGLSLVERIARAHGGTVFATNRSEGGARVGISLPA